MPQGVPDASTGADGDEKAVLAIVTTLELDPESKKYKQLLVDRLSRAAQKFVADSGSVATAFVLMNRPKDWR